MEFQLLTSPSFLSHRANTLAMRELCKGRKARDLANIPWVPLPTPALYLVVGAEIQQPPRWVHEVREVVEQPEPGPHSVDAHLSQCPVLRGHCVRQAQLERHWHTCPSTEALVKENALLPSEVFWKLSNKIIPQWTHNLTTYVLYLIFCCIYCST